MKKVTPTGLLYFKYGYALLMAYFSVSAFSSFLAAFINQEYTISLYFLVLGVLFAYFTLLIYRKTSRPVLKKLSLLHKKILFQIFLFAIFLNILTFFIVTNLSLPTYLYITLAISVLTAIYLLFQQLTKRFNTAKVQDPIVREQSRKITPSPFYLATNKIEIDKEQSIIQLKGFVHGKIEIGKDSYLYASKTFYFKGTITEIILNQEVITSIENEAVMIRIKCDYIPEDIPLVYVLTNVPYVEYRNIDSPIENPYLTGLFCVSNDVRESKGFYNVLFKEIAHAKYLVPSGNELESQKPFYTKFTELFEDDTIFAFKTLTTKDTLDAYFPVFTSTFAYDLSPDHKDITNVLVLDFHEIVQLCMSFEGNIVFNPFGPGVFFLPKPFIEDMTNSTGYRNDFKAWPGKNTQEKIHLFLQEFLETTETLEHVVDMFKLELTSIPHDDFDESFCVIEQTEQNTIQFQFARIFMDSDDEIKTYYIEVEVESDEQIDEPIRIPLSIKRKPFKKLYDHPLYQKLKDQPIIKHHSYCEEKPLNV